MKGPTNVLIPIYQLLITSLTFTATCRFFIEISPAFILLRDRLNYWPSSETDFQATPKAWRRSEVGFRYVCCTIRRFALHTCCNTPSKGVTELAGDQRWHFFANSALGTLLAGESAFSAAIVLFHANRRQLVTWPMFCNLLILNLRRSCILVMSTPLRLLYLVFHRSFSSSLNA
jgi:hypothetical protein